MLIWVIEISNATLLFTITEKKAKGEMVYFGLSGRTSMFNGNDVLEKGNKGQEWKHTFWYLGSGPGRMHVGYAIRKELSS